MAGEVLGIFVTHGSLGKELIRTAEAIIGPQQGVEIVSNSGSSLEGLSEAVRERIAKHPDASVYLFIDLLGGSCGFVCQEIRRISPGAAVFSGVNLPMVLEFFHYRDRVGDSELKERLLTRGRDGIRLL
jgi:mannose/fructose-specific phosphotransferase system component IIA